MREIKGLKFEQNKKYQAAIVAGYFDDYEADPRAWRHTFVGTFLLKWPKRTATLNRLRDITQCIPQWSDMTDDVLNDFVYDCQDAGMTMSSAKTVCAELKAVLNANKKNIPSEEYMRILTLRGETSQAVYLTRQEIQRIMDYQVVGDLERYVRRNFIVECLTGARLCDAERLTINNCDIDTGMLSYVPKKTPGIVVTVPVDEGMNLRNFLADRYKRECHEFVFNRTLRSICKNCHIDEARTVRRREKVETRPKYEMVSSHTARRSFATNLYLAGVSLEDIAMLMGHGKNIETTKGYICAERQVSPNVMAYFQPNNEES